MRAGQPIVGDVDYLPGGEQPVLTRTASISLAYYPITVDGDWWGAIGFEDCDDRRSWSLADLDGARTAAALLGAAIGRQRQEERLRDAETRYRGVVERIPAVTYLDVAHPDGVQMAFLSPQIEALLGYESQRFLDDAGVVVRPRASRRPAARRRRRAPGRRHRAHPFDEEYRMRHADGRWVWVHDTSTRILSDDGTDSTYFQGFLTDITARKEAEAALEEAEHRYRTMVEALPAVTYIDEPVPGEDINATMPFVSPQVEQVLGYPPERFTEDPRFWFELMHPDDYARLNESRRPQRLEHRARHAGVPDAARDGPLGLGTGHVRARATTRPASSTYFQGFLIDVSKRHAAEERLREAEERFRALVERMPAMVYTETLLPDSMVPDKVDYVSAAAVGDARVPGRLVDRRARPLARGGPPGGRRAGLRRWRPLPRLGPSVLDGLPHGRRRRTDRVGPRGGRAHP